MSRNSAGRRGWKRWARTVHVYLSLCGIVLMLFFGATGFVMNHEDWFGLDDSREETLLAELPVDLLAEPDRLAVVEALREQYGARGRVRKFEVGDDELTVRIEMPGRSTEARIDRANGFTTIETETRGTLDTLAQLHQGKRSGRLGSLMIDLAAVTLVLASLTGLTLWITLPRRRRLGIAALALGLLLCGSFYWYIAV